MFDMVECELKKGKAADMYFLNLIMKQFPFLVDCNESKKEIAMREYKKAKKIKILRRFEY